MPYVRKFVQGDAFESTADLVRWLEAGRYVYWNGNVRHAIFMQQQKLEMLIRLVALTQDGAGIGLFRAEPNPEFSEPNPPLPDSSRRRPVRHS